MDPAAGTGEPAVSARRASLLAVSLVLLAGVGLLVTGALRDTLTYYRTTSEVLDHPAGERVRLGGEVVPGSLREQGGQTSFRLTDGRTEVSVVQRGGLPDTFREGEDAVVEGVLDARGVFQAETVAVRHDNQYRSGASGGPSG